MPRQTRAANAPEDTRMQRDRLQAEKEKEQQARTGELTMITAAQNADDADGVWDPQSQELVEPGMTDEEREELARQNSAFLGDEDEVISEDVARQGSLGEHMVRTDGPQIGPNGVPVGEPEDELSDEVETAVATTNVRPGEALEVSDPPAVGAGQAPARTVQRLDRTKAKRIIRVNADLDPTIGRENYSFKKGRRYEVPVHVADHLHEKGYVTSFG